MKTLDADIRALEELRLKIAALNQTLAERELEGRLLRLTLETEKRQAGSTKTEAERDAKVDERYLVHVRRDIELAFDRDILLANAEAARLNVELQIAVLRRVGVGEEIA